MVMDEPLDFEEEDPLLSAALLAKRKKVIGLDDLLLDYFETGKGKAKVKAANSGHGSRGYGLDDENMDVRENEIRICKLFEKCEEKKGGEDEEDAP
ncbi:unnamed protein product [Urochloa humidicola]